MRTYNVLIVGCGEILDSIKDSKFLSKLYIASDNKEVSNISFITFKELAQKCKALEIDLAIIEDTKLVKQGIAEVLRMNHINCIAPNIQWVDTILDNLKIKQLLNRYEIQTPLVITYPNKFPLLVKAKGTSIIAKSIQEIVEIKHKIFEQSPEIAKTIYLEQYIEEKSFNLNFLFDGKKLLCLNNSFPLEAEKEVKIYSRKLEQLLITENYNFTGFITSELVFSENKLYNTGFSLNTPSLNINKDLFYIFILCLYQKLNEVNL